MNPIFITKKIFIAGRNPLKRAKLHQKVRKNRYYNNFKDICNVIFSNNVVKVIEAANNSFNVYM